MSKVMGRVASTDHIAKKRRDFDAQRVAQQQAHTVEYFHQLDDPYSHLMAQVLAQLAESYDIKVVPRLIRATGGKHQPEDEKLAVWARRDAALIAVVNNAAVQVNRLLLETSAEEWDIIHIKLVIKLASIPFL